VTEINHNINDETPQEIALLDRAYAALAEAVSVEEVRDVRDRAEAVRSYARKARLGREILVEAAALRLRSERRLGQLLQTLPLAKAAPGNQYSVPEAEESSLSQIRLQDIGITKSDSSRLQRIAAVPEEKFQAYVRESMDGNRECSTAGCLRLIRPQKRPAAVRPSKEHSPEFQALIKSSSRFVTVYADLFAIGAVGATETASELELLCAQPVRQLTQDDAHLYIRTPTMRLPDALRVLKTWGFEYAFCVSCQAIEVADAVNLKNTHKLLLVGCCGDLEFPDLSKETWLQVQQHGFSAEALATLIQHLSPGPYVDLTSNVEPLNADWTTVAGGDQQ